MSGNILAANVTFHIEYQGEYPAVDIAIINFTDMKLMDHVGEIPTRPPVPATITIKGIIALPMPYLEAKF